jgi:hypothetical protein
VQSVGEIVTMVSKDFIKLVLIASVIAFPVAWWMMSMWLQSFAYRINISWWIFALAGLLTIAIRNDHREFPGKIKAADWANPVQMFENGIEVFFVYSGFLFIGRWGHRPGRCSVVGGPPNLQYSFFLSSASLSRGSEE